MNEAVEWANVVACCVLLEALFRVVSMLPKRSALPQRMALAAMAVVVGLQASLSFAPDAPPVSWQTALLLVAGAVCAVVWRRTMLRLVHIAYPFEEPAERKRRQTDHSFFDPTPIHRDFQ